MQAPITLLHEDPSQGTEGTTPILLAGTFDRLYRHTPDGSWVMIMASHNCDDGERYASRFLVAQLAGVFFIGHTRGGFWTYTTGDSAEDDGHGTYSYARQVDDLIVLGIEQAQCVAQLKGFFFAGNLKVDGVNDPSLLHWSDFEGPAAWIPGGESQAGYVSFGSDHIVALMPMGNSLIVYCNRSIWIGAYTGDESVWAFERIYSGDQVPFYPRAIADVGDAHVYMGANTLFMLLRGERQPRLLPWLDDLSGIVYQRPRPELLADLPAGVLVLPDSKVGPECAKPCMFFDSNDSIVYLSWQDSTPDANPEWTVAFSLIHRTSCVVDHGFTAGSMTRQPVSGERMTYRKWIFDELACPAHPAINEHDPFASLSPPENPPDHIYNDTEDPSLPPSPDSWCSRLAGTCLTVCPPCHGPSRLIMASSEDYAIKEFAWEFDRREMIAGIEASGDWNNIPTDPQKFPDEAEGANPASEAVYDLRNYATLFQSDMILGREYNTALGTIEPALTRLDHEATDETAAMPWTFHGQGAAAASARCSDWSEDFTDDFNCVPANVARKSYLLGEENPVLQLDVEGHYVGFRFWCGGPENIGPVAFIGYSFYTSDPTSLK